VGFHRLSLVELGRFGSGLDADNIYSCSHAEVCDEV